MLAVSGKERVWFEGRPCSVQSVLAGLDEGAWQRLSAGSGSKGPRFNDWQCVGLTAAQAGWRRCLLVRRSLKADGKLTAYAVYAPCGTDLATLVSVAGRRWCIEMCFEAAKGEVGLDEYEVRSWTGWYRHVTLVDVGVGVAECRAGRPLAGGGKKTLVGEQSVGLQSVAGLVSC